MSKPGEPLDPDDPLDIEVGEHLIDGQSFASDCRKSASVYLARLSPEERTEFFIGFLTSVTGWAMAEVGSKVIEALTRAMQEGAPEVLRKSRQ